MNKLLLSYINTSAGFWLVSFLVPLIVLEITGSALTVTISYAMNIAPYIIFTPFAGVFCDAYNRKKLIVVGELLCCLTSGVLFISLLYTTSVSLVIFLGFAISSLSAMHHPVFQSIIPDIFPPDKIKDINANIGVIDSTVGIIAPAVLGMLLSIISKREVLLVVALCYLLSCIIILRIRYVKSSPSIRMGVDSVFLSLKEGFFYVLNKKQLRNLAILFFFINIGIRVVFPNLMWTYSEVFKQPEDIISLLFVIIGFGSIIGAKTGACLIGKYSDLRIITSAAFIIALCSFLLTVASTAIMHAILWGFSSLVQSVIVVTFFTYRQKVTDSYILGRVVSITRLMSYLAIPLASVSSGLVLTTYNSVNYIYVISGACILFPLILFCFFTRRHF